jgi:hypothetical protein
MSKKKKKCEGKEQTKKKYNTEIQATFHIIPNPGGLMM